MANNPFTVSKSEYFPWYSRSASLPWDRQFTNFEFLRTEKKRLVETEKWYTVYFKAKVMDALPEVMYYVLPTELPGNWCSVVNDSGDYQYKGLSCLKNSPQFPLIALFPMGVKLPDDYSLIRIISSKKVILMNNRLPMQYNCEYAVLIESFEQLPSDYIYQDVPFDKTLISDILYKNLGQDEYVAKSLQSPLLSSPFVMGKYGGIGMASMLRNTPFVDELLKSIQLMLPPEYRAIQPPADVLKGQWVSPLNQSKVNSIKFHFSEQSAGSKGQVGYSTGLSYNSISRQIQNRLMFNGEYSFIGTVLSDGTAKEVFDDMLKNFTRTEVTAFYLNKLKESDVYLKHLQKDTTEDVWLNIVHARQFNPTLNVKDINIKTWENRIKKDWDVFLPGMGYPENMNFVRDQKVKQTMNNIIRLAQANARGEARAEITEKDLENARNMFTSSAEELVSHPTTVEAKKSVVKQKEHNRVQSIKVLLDQGTSTIEEMWQQLKNTGYYNSIQDFEQLIDWLYKKGIIYKPNNGYSWT